MTMTRPRLTVSLTALHLLIWRAWAVLEVSMEDRKEVMMGNETEIHCMFSLDDPTTNPNIEWFMGSPGGSKQRIHYKIGSEEPQVENTNLKDRIRVFYSQKNSVLNISSVQIVDEREYFCRVTVETNSDEKHTQLLVFNPPSRPIIEAEQYVSADSEKLEKIATCTVENAHPTPKILWHKNDRPLQTDEDVKVINSETVNPNNLQTVKSELQLKMVKKEDKDAEFYCEVSYFTVGSERMVESPRIKITVHYKATAVTMQQISPRGLVKEGDTVEIICEGDGTLTKEISFSRDGELLESKNDVLVLENVSRANNGQYLCTYLEDWINELHSSFELIVNFMDDVVITPKQPIEVDEGQDLTLTCNALSSLPTRTVWYKDGEKMDEGHILRVKSVSSKTSGTYSCKVEASELPELRRENSVDVIVRGRPKIKDGVEVIQMETEKVFNLSCSAIGRPTPNITWTLSDEQAVLGEWSMEADGNVISIISIRTTSTINATCTATSEMGTDVASRSVEPREFKDQTTITGITSSSTTGPPTTYNQTEPPAVTREHPKKNERVRKESSGFIIAILIILVLLLAILGSVLYFLYKKGKIPCGRSGKQDLTKESASKDDFVVEMKSGKSEEAVLLQGVNGDKKIPNDQ